jgi:hypothetical protein
MKFGSSRARAVRRSVVSAHGVVQVTGLQRQGALRRGELVPTRGLGTCEAVFAEPPRAIVVRDLATDNRHRLVIDSEPGARHARLSEL